MMLGFYFNPSFVEFTTKRDLVNSKH